MLKVSNPAVWAARRRSGRFILSRTYVWCDRETPVARPVRGVTYTSSPSACPYHTIVFDTAIVFFHVRPPRVFEISPSPVAFVICLRFRARSSYLPQTTPMLLSTGFHGVSTTAAHDARESHRTFHAGKCIPFENIVLARRRRLPYVEVRFVDASDGRDAYSPTFGTIDTHVKCRPYRHAVVSDPRRTRATRTRRIYYF